MVISSFPKIEIAFTGVVGWLKFESLNDHGPNHAKVLADEIEINNEIVPKYWSKKRYVIRQRLII